MYSQQQVSEISSFTIPFFVFINLSCLPNSAAEISPGNGMCELLALPSFKLDCDLDFFPVALEILQFAVSAGSPYTGLVFFTDLPTCFLIVSGTLTEMGECKFTSCTFLLSSIDFDLFAGGT
jgi:hypothetical protein